MGTACIYIIVNLTNEGIEQMSKLLATYKSAPTLQNAKRVRAYDAKHMMAACLLSPEETNLLAEAIRQANG
jgi:hypothetical protein